MSIMTASQERTVIQPPAWYRWAVLVIISLAMCGNYYVYDAISPLAKVLKDQLGLSDENIGLLNAIYSIPNIFMVLVGGVIIDRIGTRRATLLFGGLCTLGAIQTAATDIFWVMATGRLIFGLGAESLIVAVTAALAKWFRGKELSFAFGLNLTIARLGSFAALNSPSWAKRAYEHWQWPLLIAVAAGMLCIVGPVLYALMERSAERRFSLGAEGATDKIVWRDLFSFGRSYWYVVALCVTFYSAIFPFQTFAVEFFMDVHGVSHEYGGFLSSLLTLFAMICTPLFGLFVDYWGRRATLMCFGSLLLLPVYLVMAYSPINLDVFLSFGFLRESVRIDDFFCNCLVPMLLMGVAFSLIPAVMWPSVTYLVSPARLGTALGLMTMIQNIGLAGYNLLIGWANTHWAAGAENPPGYRPGMWMFSVLGLLALLFAWLLRRSETGPHAHGLETITAN
jgi:MFS family permease